MVPLFIIASSLEERWQVLNAALVSVFNLQIVGGSSKPGLCPVAGLSAVGKVILQATAILVGVCIALGGLFVVERLCLKKRKVRPLSMLRVREARGTQGARVLRSEGLRQSAYVSVRGPCRRVQRALVAFCLELRRQLALVLHGCMRSAAEGARELLSNRMRRRFLRRPRGTLKNQLWPRYAAGILSTTLLCYSTIVKLALRLLHCVEVVGDLRLFRSADHVCYASWQWLVWALLCSWVIPLPIALLVARMRLRRRLLSARGMLFACAFPFVFLSLRVAVFLTLLARLGWRDTSEEKWSHDFTSRRLGILGDPLLGGHLDSSSSKATVSRQFRRKQTHGRSTRIREEKDEGMVGAPVPSRGGPHAKTITSTAEPGHALPAPPSSSVTPAPSHLPLPSASDVESESRHDAASSRSATGSELELASSSSSESEPEAGPPTTCAVSAPREREHLPSLDWSHSFVSVGSNLRLQCEVRGSHAPTGDGQSDASAQSTTARGAPVQLPTTSTTPPSPAFDVRPASPRLPPSSSKLGAASAPSSSSSGPSAPLSSSNAGPQRSGDESSGRGLRENAIKTRARSAEELTLFVLERAFRLRYWETVLMVRRLVLVSLYVLITSPFVRLLAMTCFVLVSAAHHMHSRPFRMWRAQLSESVALCIQACLGMLNLRFAVVEVLAVGPSSLEERSASLQESGSNMDDSTGTLPESRFGSHLSAVLGGIEVVLILLLPLFMIALHLPMLVRWMCRKGHHHRSNRGRASARSGRRSDVHGREQLDQDGVEFMLFE
mmetsp:Transcript_23291/g.75020  ORF Transcript_23291/g.75020 Transcript_23291/m.75020 type:complete len:780 (+) Transcript_23291:2-2341(+)